MTQTLGWLATVLFTICYIPQIKKTWRTQNVDGVSISLFCIQLVGNCVALLYAFRIGQEPLIIKYVLGIVFLLATLSVIFLAKSNRV